MTSMIKKKIYIYSKASQGEKPCQVSGWHCPRAGSIVGCSAWKKEESKSHLFILVSREEQKLNLLNKK